MERRLRDQNQTMGYKRGEGRVVKGVGRETIKRTKYSPVVYWK